MRDPLPFVFTLLFLVLIGEGVLWAKRRDAGVPAWKVRALLWSCGLFVAAFQYFRPLPGNRFVQVLYALVLVLAGLLVGLYSIASILLRGVNSALTRAHELQALGKTAEAVEVLDAYRRKAARLDKSTESILLSEMARLALELRDPASAQRYLDQAENLSTANQGVYSVRSDLLQQTGQTEAALEQLRRGLQHFPQSVWLHTVLVERLADAGQNEEARVVLAQTIELMEQEERMDVADPDEWRELRIGPLVTRLGSSPGRLVTDAD